MVKQANSPKRWVRDYVFDALKDLGIHHIFGVPGTNEIPIIDGTSLPENDVSYIECLHENIAIGAAMGSARMTGKPGVLLVHVTPGIAHTIGNLFNAWRSKVPLVILCAQQQNELVTQEPLLASNLVDLARNYTRWAHEVRTPEEVPMVLQRAFKVAMSPPNGPVFVAIPWEFTMREIAPDAKLPGITRISPHFTGDSDSIRNAATLLRAAKKPIIICGDAVGYANAWPEMQALAERIGAPVLLQSFSSLANFPNNDYHWQGELPGSQGGMQGVFKDHDVAFLCGFANQAQVTVFKYSDGPLIPAHIKQVYLTNDTWDIGKNYFGESAVFGDIKTTLPLITDQIAATPAARARNRKLIALDAARAVQWQEYIAKARVAPEIWAVLIADALASEIRERKMENRFVYVHEAVSDPAPFQMLLPLGTEAAPTSYYCVSGGSLGWSMPAALGIKLSPEGWQGIHADLVINVVGDGSSLFYPQCWWTAAHQKLPILTIITNNHEYHTLQLGLQTVVNTFGSAPGYNWKPTTMTPEYLTIQKPDMDFKALAAAMGGLAGNVVKKPADVAPAIRAALEYILTQKASYVLDMRTDQATPPTPTTDAETLAQGKYACQPKLDMIHGAKGKLKKAGAAGGPDNVAILF